MLLTNDFSREIWYDTYKYEEEKDLSDTFLRNAKAIASVEATPELREEWTNKFNDVMQKMQLCPAGRILANAGTHYKGTTLFNCYVGSRPSYDIDSLDGILETLRIQAQTLKSEGGWGMNFSFIRPRGSTIHGVGVETPGAVKYMELFNRSSDIITAGSGKEVGKKGLKKKIRKGAQMGMLSVWHPDILEFITAKRVANRLDKFNVSVVSDKKFMEKVLRYEEFGQDSEWDFIFPETTHEAYKSEWDGNIYRWLDKGYPVRKHGSIAVSKLWDLIMRSTYEFNDPGILFEDRANATHLFNYNPDKYILCTNPCGEQCMPYGSVCDLASIPLPSFYIDGKFDFVAFYTAVQTAVRFLDNVNDYSSTPHETYTRSARESRRIGLGLMGWGSLLYLMKVRFGSDEAEVFKQSLMQEFVYAAVTASIDLAIEKGTFVGCDKDKLADHFFWKQIGLQESTIETIRKYGLRNSALFSIQPNGNTGCLMNLMSGGAAEPIFMHEYIRTVIIQSAPDNIKDRCPKYWQGEFHETDLFKFTKEGSESILKGVDENGITWKIDKNRGLTKEVLCEDYAVKKLKESDEWDATASWAVTTTNLSVEDHLKDLKGWAKWIDSAISKTVNIPNDYSYEDFKKIYLEAYKTGVIKGITTYRAGTMLSVLSAKTTNKIEKTNAPKRPKVLPAQVFYPMLKGQKYYVVCGIYENELYEIFAGKLTDDIPHSANNGNIIKVKKGHYRLIHEDEIIIDNLIEHCDHSEEAICRLLSAGLRHGSDVKFLKEQLSNCKGELYSFGKVLGRILGKFIPDNTLSKDICPECGAQLVFTEGCKGCFGDGGCGWSKC